MVLCFFGQMKELVPANYLKHNSVDLHYQIDACPKFSEQRDGTLKVVLAASLNTRARDL
jgi:hypothetical protein